MRVSDEALIVEGKQIQIASGHFPDVHECLVHYPHSSYHHFARKYGEEFLTDAWTRYLIPDYLAHDDD